MNTEQKKLVSEIETALITAEEKAGELVTLLEEYESQGDEDADNQSDQDYEKAEEASNEVSTTLGNIQQLFEEELK